MKLEIVAAQAAILLHLFLECIADLAPEECRNQGFTANLLCSSCKELAQFNLTTLVSSCEDCCTKDQVEEVGVRFPFAHLEVCGWKIGRYPQVQAFIKSERVNDWPGLRINYVRGADPYIKLLNDDGDMVEMLNIEKWNTDTIIEFLNERLAK